MIIGITGGTGFIGKRLVLRHLGKGDTVRVLTRKTPDNAALPKDVVLCVGDLTEVGQNLRSFVNGVDLLYHCAAEINSPSLMDKVHVQGTRNLIAAASGSIGHWVQLSSVGVYGPQRRGILTEEVPLHPVGPYEITKAESDRLVIDAGMKGSFSYSILRPSNVFGPDMSNQSLFKLISLINRGLFFYIGKPSASANYIHVDNVVEGLALCGKIPAARGQIYNLSDCRPMEEFVEIIAGALHKPVPRLRLPEMPIRWMGKLLGRLPRFPLTESRVNALTNKSMYSIERIRHELGYLHLLPMEEGLRQMVEVWKRVG